MRTVRPAALAVLLLFPPAIFAGPGHGGGSHGGGSRSGGSHGGGSHGSGSHGDGSHGVGGRSCGGGSHDGGSHRGGSRGTASHHGRGRGGVIYGEPYGGGGYIGDGFGPGYGFVDVEEYDWSTVDTDVSPGEARVHLEGRYIGSASDFHGDPDYLYLRPGPYKLEFRLDGYEPLLVNIDAIPDAKIAIHQDLHRIPGAEQSKPPAAPTPKRGVLRYWGKYRGVLEAYDSDLRHSRSEGDADDSSEGEPEARPEAETPEPTRPPESPPTAQSVMQPARLSLSIRPADAAVYLDGRFLGSAEELDGPIGVPVQAGKHRLAVVRPGFKAQELEIEVVRGESKRVEVSLER